jgi:enamine deaminase RidA (YjgF/YER057c/UK114 family)
MTEQHERDVAFDALEPTLSAAPGADATVRAAIRHGDLLFLSGQVAFEGPDLLTTGRLGDDVDVPTGQACARQCAINLLGRTRELLGSLANVEQVVKLTVFVASAPGFREQHLVANGASQVFRDVLGDAGRHARSAVGMAELPLGTPVEVEAIIAVANSAG